MDVDGADRQADGFGSNLGEGCVGALADLGGAHLYGHAPVLVQRHAAGGGLKRDGIDVRFISKQRHAHAAAAGAGLILIPAALFVPADSLTAFLQCLGQAVGVHGDAVVRVDITGLHTVFKAEFQRVHAECVRQIIGQRFGDEASLRDAVAAHGAGSRPVGVDRIALGIERDPVAVTLLENVCRVGGDGMAV